MTTIAKECLAEGCDYLTFSGRYCQVHALDVRNNRTFIDRGPSPLCRIEGCNRRVAYHKLGLCERHKAQIKRNMNPVVPKEKICENCHRAFMPSSVNRKIKFCSELCQARAGNVRQIYKIEVSRIWEMLEKQDYKCAICQLEINRETAHLDHDHNCCPTNPEVSHQRSCGKCIRGLLCRYCNFGLGNFRDDIERLHGAITYLTAWDGMGGA